MPKPTKRKRGGQLGNTNALKHGFYTKRTAHSPISTNSGTSTKKSTTELVYTRELARFIFQWIQKYEHTIQATLMFNALSLAIFKPAVCSLAIELFLENQPSMSLDDAFHLVLSQAGESID